MSVPLSLATTNGTLHSPNKYLLADILTKDVLTPPTISLDGPSCLLIDGQALFDVIFDRYRPESIKAGTRTKRKKGKRPVRRQIESESVPLPSDWSNFMALEDNKADLALLLSNYLIDHSLVVKQWILLEDYPKLRSVKSSDPTLDMSMLEADHEEADTRLILPLYSCSYGVNCCVGTRYRCPCVAARSAMTNWDVQIC